MEETVEPSTSEVVEAAPASNVIPMSMLNTSPAAQSLVAQVMNAHRTQEQQFYLVILPEDDYPRMETFVTLEPMLVRVGELLGEQVSVFPFLGAYMPITKGPNRFMVTPFGNVPLFKIPGSDEISVEEHGYLGPDAEELEIPQTPQAPVDEEDEEEEADIISSANELIEAVDAVLDAEDDTPVLPPVD